jgi:hypothetical protein
VLALPGNLTTYNNFNSRSGTDLNLEFDRISGGVVLWNNGGEPDGDAEIILHFNDGVGFVDVRDNNPSSVTDRLKVVLCTTSTFESRFQPHCHVVGNQTSEEDPDGDEVTIQGNSL